MSEAARQTAKETTSGKPKTFAADAFAAGSPTSGLAALSIPRREPRPQDVQIEILFAASAIPICTRCATNGKK